MASIHVSCDDPGCPDHGVAASNARQNEFFRQAARREDRTPLLVSNVAQRLQEWRTRREPISTLEARKRLVEAER